MAFFHSTWFLWACIGVIACTIFYNLWLSFIEESGTEPSEFLRITLKIIFFIPMLIVGGVMVAIEKKAWAALIFGIVVVGIFVWVWINDPGEGPVPWNN